MHFFTGPRQSAPNPQSGNTTTCRSHYPPVPACLGTLSESYFTPSRLSRHYNRPYPHLHKSQTRHNNHWIQYQTCNMPYLRRRQRTLLLSRFWFESIASCLPAPVITTRSHMKFTRCQTEYSRSVGGPPYAMHKKIAPGTRQASIYTA